MKVLIIGSGAREHALAAAVAACGAQVYSAGPWQNPGIAALTQQAGDHLQVAVQETDKIAAFARQQGINLALPGGEETLAAAAVDRLRDAGIAAMGPTAKLARMESSKHYARETLHRHRLGGNPFYQQVGSETELAAVLEKLGDRYVLKADGLCGGKGVKLADEHLHSHAEALEFGRQLLAANGKLVVEELLDGQEFSLLSLADASACVHAPLVQDHKRAFVGDRGPNTGGMGSYTMADGQLPFINSAAIKQAQQFNEAVLEALASDNNEAFRGVLYGSFMLTAAGLRVIEYNVRFGDPEVLNLIELAEADWLQAFEAISADRLASVPFSWKKEYSVCRYLVPEGYPHQPLKGVSLSLPRLETDLSCYYGAVARKGDSLVLQGSRAFALVARSVQGLPQACEVVERGCAAIDGPLFYRHDIGSETSLQRKIEQMRTLNMFSAAS